MHRFTVKKEPSNLWNRYRPYRRGIRFFPHIIPIAFPLIFPLGISLFFGLFHVLFNVLGITSQSQQPPYYQPQSPYYQPTSPAGQEQPYQQYGQGYQYEQPIYRPQGQVNDNDQPQAQYPEQMPPMQQ